MRAAAPPRRRTGPAPSRARWLVAAWLAVASVFVQPALLVQAVFAAAGNEAGWTNICTAAPPAKTGDASATPAGRGVAQPCPVCAAAPGGLAPPTALAALAVPDAHPPAPPPPPAATAPRPPAATGLPPSRAPPALS